MCRKMVFIHPLHPLFFLFSLVIYFFLILNSDTLPNDLTSSSSNVAAPQQTTTSSALYDATDFQFHGSPYQPNKRYDFAILFNAGQCEHVCACIRMIETDHELQWTTQYMQGYREFIDPHDPSTTTQKAEIERADQYDQLKDPSEYCFCLSKAKYEFIKPLFLSVGDCQRELKNLETALEIQQTKVSEPSPTLDSQESLKQCLHELMLLQHNSCQLSIDTFETNLKLKRQTCYSNKDVLHNWESTWDLLYTNSSVSLASAFSFPSFSDPFRSSASTDSTQQQAQQHEQQQQDQQQDQQQEEEDNNINSSTLPPVSTLMEHFSYHKLRATQLQICVQRCESPFASQYCLEECLNTFFHALKFGTPQLMKNFKKEYKRGDENIEA